MIKKIIFFLHKNLNEKKLLCINLITSTIWLQFSRFIGNYCNMQILRGLIDQINGNGMVMLYVYQNQGGYNSQQMYNEWNIGI